jgi:hypothetical protein
MAGGSLWGGFLFRSCGCSGAWCWRSDRRCGRCRNGGRDAGVSADTNRFLSFLDFDFCDVRGFQQLDEFFYLPNVHEKVLGINLK